VRIVAVLLASLFVAVPAAGAEPFDVAPGDAVSIVAAPEGDFFAVTRDADGVLTSCPLVEGGSTCRPSVELPTPEGEQAGFEVLLRRRDGALFVFDGRETGSLWVLRSDDSGVTWSQPRLVATDLPGFGDVALTGDGRHADVIADDIGSYVRVDLDGDPVRVPFLNLAFGLAGHAALNPAILALANGTVLASFGEIPPPGPLPGGVRYGIRRHGPRGSLRRARRWSAWKPGPATDSQTLFSRGNRAYVLRGGPELLLARVRSSGKLFGRRGVRDEMTGPAVGTLSLQGTPNGRGRPPTVHVAAADAGSVQYTRTKFPESCPFGIPESVPAENARGLDIAAAQSSRGLVAWVENDVVRANYFRGGANTTCR
jgi:hypothetical protein